MYSHPEERFVIITVYRNNIVNMHTRGRSRSGAAPGIVRFCRVLFCCILFCCISPNVLFVPDIKFSPPFWIYRILQIAHNETPNPMQNHYNAVIHKTFPINTDVRGRVFSIDWKRQPEKANRFCTLVRGKWYRGRMRTD